MRQNGTSGRTMKPSVPFYRALLERYPRLSNGEYLALFERYRAGSKTAGVRIVMHSVQFSIWKAHHFSGRNVPYEDLVQAGLNELWYFAIDAFDPARKVLWHVYAGCILRHAMYRLIQNTRSDRPWRVPVNEDERRAFAVKTRERYYTHSGRMLCDGELLTEMRATILRRVQRRFMEQHEGRAPTKRELARKLATNHCYAMTAEQVEEALTIDQPVFSYDAMISSEQTFADITPDPSKPEKCVELAGCSGDIARAEQTVRVAVHRLDERSQNVIRLRFGWSGCEEHSLNDVGVRMSLSRERIRQLEHDAIQRIAANLQKTTEEVTMALEAIGELMPIICGTRRRRRQLPARSS